MPHDMQALIFDCDGVLVDTERDGHRVAFNQAFAAEGLATEWSVDRYGVLLTTGGGKERMRRHFDETGWPVTTDQRDTLIARLHRQKTDIFMRLIEAGRCPCARRGADGRCGAGGGAKGCGLLDVERTGGGNRCAGAAGPGAGGPDHHLRGRRGGAEKARPRDLHAGRHDPGPDPAACVVVEDSHIGLSAAKAAGMRCVVTRSAYTHDEDFTGADRVVDDLDQGIDLALCQALTQMEDAPCR